MPESYFHVHCARGSYRGSGAGGYHIPALILGAAGPDILFYHVARPDLHRLGRRMHTQHCGPFLSVLVRRAEGRLLQSYVLGFLSHYAADSTLHPWIEARSEGHAPAESAMDRYYLLLDKGRVLARAEDSAPALEREERLAIGNLLRSCLREVYDLEVSAADLAKSLEEFRRWKSWLRDEGGRKARLARRLERALRLKPGILEGHLITAQPTGDGTPPHELTDRAEALGGELMTAARDYWAGNLGPMELARKIGNRSYMGK